MERNENPTSEDQPLAIKSLGGGNVDWGAAPIPGAAFAHWDRAKRREWQGERLELLLRQILPLNRFYATKWRDIERPWGFVSADPSEGWLQLPFTLKSELQSGPPVEARVAPTPAIVEEVSGVASPRKHAARVWCVRRPASQPNVSFGTVCSLSSDLGYQWATDDGVGHMGGLAMVDGGLAVGFGGGWHPGR